LILYAACMGAVDLFNGTDDFTFANVLMVLFMFYIGILCGVMPFYYLLKCEIKEIFPNDKKNISNKVETPRKLCHYFHCPYCNRKLKIEQIHEKTTIRCKGCHETFDAKP